MKNTKSLATLTLLVLTAMIPVFAIVSVNAQIPSSPLHPSTTIVNILVSAGGTTIPPNGTTEIESETLTLTAIPDAGFEFAYWVYSGPYPGTEAGHSGASLFYENPIDIGNDAQGYSVFWQAVFVPVGTLSQPSQAIGIAYVVVAVVAVAAVVGVGAFLVGKRSTKASS